jgi:CheY-like chemotaxis protein
MNMKAKSIKTILIADEDNVVRKSLSSLFSGIGYRVVSVSGGADAILRSKEMKPDMVLADVSLSDGDGYEVSGKIKDDPVLEDTPVILLVSWLGAFDEVKAAEVRADDFMIKPLKSEIIIKKVESLISQYEKRDKRSEFNLLSHAEEAIEQSVEFKMFNDNTIYKKETNDRGSYGKTEYINSTEEIKIERETSWSGEEIILLEEDCESDGKAGYINGAEEIKIEPEASGSGDGIILLEDEFVEYTPNAESDLKKINTLDEKSKAEIVDKVSEILMKRLSEVIPESISKLVDTVLNEEIKKIKED